MRTIRHAMALAAACLLAACGGSDAPSEPTSPAAQPASVVRSDFVRLEGSHLSLTGCLTASA